MYSTIADVRAITGMSSSVKIPDATITAKIVAADAIINAKIGAVYQLPLSATCDMITMLSNEIASLLLTMDIYGEETQNTDKGWERKMKAFYNMLEDIRQLKMRLFDTNGAELSRITTRQPGFYPTDASSDPGAVNSTQPKITMNEKF